MNIYKRSLNNHMRHFFTLNLKASRLGANLISNGKEFHNSTILLK